MNSHNDIDNVQWCKLNFPFPLFTGSSFQEGLKLASIPTFHFPQLFQTLMTFHLISHSTQFLIPTRCHQTNTNPTHIHLSPTMMNLTTTPTVTPQAPHRWSSCDLNTNQSLPTRYPSINLPWCWRAFPPPATRPCTPSVRRPRGAHILLRSSRHLHSRSSRLCSTSSSGIRWACCPSVPCSCWTCPPGQASLWGGDDAATAMTILQASMFRWSQCSRCQSPWQRRTLGSTAVASRTRTGTTLTLRPAAR